MKTLKTIIVSIAILASNQFSIAQSSVGAIKGKVITTDNEPLYGGLVKITQSGNYIGGTQTDENGKYSYKPLNPGFYEITVTSIETRMKQITNIEVNPEKTTYVDLKVATNETEEIVITSDIYYKPLIDPNITTMKSISGVDILHLAVPRGDINAIITTIATDVTLDSDGRLHVRGSRGDATAYIVDGVKSQNITAVSGLSIENLSVITGGIPAQYGDMLGGVIVVTTKDYFSGIRAKHMRQNYQQEESDRKKREKNAKIEEDRRKKEIEEEIRLEEEAKAKKL
jgi:hypothetical protein